MSRVSTNRDPIATLYQLVCRQPGNRAHWYALRIGVQPTNIARVLASAELIGYYMAEDDHGRLYPPPWHNNRSFWSDDDDTDPLP